MSFKKIRGNFVDTLRLYLQGGAGGAGHPKYGGLGGAGGNIYVEASKNMSLKALCDKDPKRRYKAENGLSSQQFVLVGKKGQDTILKAPLGTVCQTDDGTIVGEVNALGDRVLVAQGGEGGSPTNGFMGQIGEKHSIKLVLKTMADVGLVGFPNAGKSTLLKAISNAKPKIASYAFTTLKPNVGILKYDDERRISMADLPGLIEGAWANYGLGHSFLRHVERTKLLLLVVDVNGFQLKHDKPRRSAMENVLLLNKELELYDSTLLNKPAMLVINKMDVPGAKDIYDRLLDEFNNWTNVQSYPEEMRPKEFLQIKEVVGISAKTNVQSVNHVKERLRHLLDLYAPQDPDIPTHGDATILQPFLNESGPKLI